MTREEVQIRLGLDNSAVGPGMAQAGRDIEGGAEKIKLFNFHGREMYKLMGAVDRIAPGLGEILRGLFNPETLGIGLLIVGIELLVRWFQKSAQAAKEAMEKQIDSVIAARKASDEARKAEQEAAESFRKAMESSLSSLNDTVKTKFAERAALLNAEADQYRKLIDLQEERDLAAAKGNATEQNAIRARYKALKDEVGAQTESQKLALRQKELEEHRRHTGTFKSEIESLRVQEARLRQDKAFREIHGRTPEISDAIEKALRAKVGQLSGPGTLEAHLPWMDPFRGLLERKREKELAAAEQALQTYLNDKGATEEHQKKMKQLSEKLAKLEHDYGENSKEVQQLTLQLAQERRENDVKRQKTIAPNTALGADILAAEAAIDPQLRRFLDLRLRLLSGRMSASDLSLYGGEARREFNALSLSDKIKAMQPENLPQQLQNDASHKVLQDLLNLATGAGFNINKLPTDD